MNRTSDLGRVHQLLGALGSEQLPDIGHRVVELGGKQYAVNFVRSKRLGWYLVDYLPVEAILKPITMSSALFYVTFALLLVMGLAVAYLLYRHVQYPIRKLLQGFSRCARATCRRESMPGRITNSTSCSSGSTGWRSRSRSWWRTCTRRKFCAAKRL
ncbi:hypothetical protein LJK88_05325 [Paenibacillus sp. P26]|nr:hypothetical protein LJK88_05325 [Paenibacillus sp. P26]